MSQIHEENNLVLTKELNSLLDTFNPPTIDIKLNEEKTVLCFEYKKCDYTIENDGNTLDKDTYDKVRETLQNKRRVTPKDKLDANFKSAEEQIINFLIKQNKFEDHRNFLKEFQQFINDLPEVSESFLDCRRRLMEINFDEIDVDGLSHDDERLKEIKNIHDEMLSSFDNYKALGEKYIKQKNLNDNSLDLEKEQGVNELLLQFEKKHPKQSKVIKRIFEILNGLERCEKLDGILRIIADKLGLITTSFEKLVSYFNVNVERLKQRPSKIFDISKWYNDEDMKTFSRSLEMLEVDLDNQFSNMLTEDGIKSMPSMELLKENQPRYICYNIGGVTMQDNSGVHWVAMLLVKRADKVIILYKDSKGDWNNSSRNIEATFREHYNNKLEFIRNLNAEQADDSSGGPMTINNLHIMAKKIKEFNDAGEDGIGELIKTFKYESGEMAFTTQDQVPSVRISHLIESTLRKKVNLKDDNGNETLATIIEKLHVSENKQLQKDNIERYINLIHTFYDEIKSWGAEALKAWSDKNAGQLSKHVDDQAVFEKEILKAIAVMDRANEIATGGHRLRDSQKVAILIFMVTNEKGHISQINTGEGKTTIISVIAALKIMQGYNVHVITSNNVLAAEGVKDKNIFYSLLNITVADNNPDEKYTDGPKPCYSKHIVYGSITSFQFDWLRDSFEKLKTLGGIDYSNIWVLLDEIDSLLIDQGSNIAKLSGPFPGMESLRYIYINIWVALVKAEETVTNQILENLKRKAEDLERIEMNDEEKQLKYEEYEDTLRESYLCEVKRNIMEHKDDLINKTITAHHLHQYAEDSLEKWIEHAFAAKYQYQENVEYKIVEDTNGEEIIIPVDNQNTGVSMKNTILSNGLHQFLQIKHNLCLTYESLTSCYVSNLEYIKKYGSKLSGVTGTLGSTPEQNLLESVFNLSFSIIPPFKSKIFALFPGRMSTDESFVNEVAIAALGELTRLQPEYSHNENEKDKVYVSSRAVLIVCASILDVIVIAEEVKKQAKAAGLCPNVLKFADEKDAHITNNTIGTNTIVIATNLAGRGTDFKTSLELEQNGGLHVIEAFLACNQRVQDQGFGRTSRQGNRGTGQIIARSSEVETLGIPVNSNEKIHFDDIMLVRDKLEEQRVNDIRENKILELEFKGQLFNKFAEEYGSLKEKHQTGFGTDVIKWIYVLRDLKEKWAFWLEKQAYTTVKIKKIVLDQESIFSTNNQAQLIKSAVDKEYKMFLNESQQILGGTISHNPYYSICLAEKYLDNCCNKSEREKAKSELQHALNISSSCDLLYSAYMKLFEISIDDGGQIIKRYKKAVGKIIFVPLETDCPDYKIRGKEHLEKAERAIAIEHDYLKKFIEGEKGTNEVQVKTVLSAIINQGEDTELDSNLFLKHLQARLVCLGTFKGHIESLLDQIKVDGKDGIVIDCKAPKYLSKLDSNNEIKKYVTDRSVDELEFVGMSSVYQLRKIHDVHEEVIRGAQIQIGGACALLASAAAFPVLLPVNGPLAGALFSEGITDIITALIQQGQSAFDKKDYIKGKVISYGITILTMGIGALMSSTKILQEAVNACRGLATKLRSVTGPFAGVCKFLARQLDKLATYLEKVIEAIEFARKTAVEQAKYLAGLKDANKLEQFQKLQKTLKLSDAVQSYSNLCTQIVTQSAKGAIRGVIISVATEKIVIASLSNLMNRLQPLIKEQVFSAVSRKIREEFVKGTLKCVPDSKVDEALEKCFNSNLEDITDVCREIGLGVMRHSSSWKMQLAALALDSFFSVKEIKKCTNKVCDKFVFILNLESDEASKGSGNKMDVFINKIVSAISDTASNLIYTKLVAITGKLVVTLPKVVYRGYKAHQENCADKKAVSEMREKLQQIDVANNVAKLEDTNCTHNAVSEVLGIDSKALADSTNLAPSVDGATVEDAKNLFKLNGIDVTTCGSEDALTQFKQQGSDRGVVCLVNNDGFGHTIAVSKEGDTLMVHEGGRKMPLAEYKEKFKYSNEQFIIPKNINSSTMQDIQHKCNLNRIRNATHPIDYVGKDDGMKYGKKALKDPEKKAFEDKLQEALRAKGSVVLNASNGCIGSAGRTKDGHARNHLIHNVDEEKLKKIHSVFPHGIEQQDYLVNAAARHEDYKAKLEELLRAQKDVEQRLKGQELELALKKISQTVVIPIADLLKSKHLSEATKSNYMKMSNSENKAPFNMTHIICVIYPAAEGSGRPYQIQTFYPMRE